MQKHYKEKHLKATLYKIERIEQEENFLTRNKWFVIAFGVIISLRSPYDIIKHNPEYMKDYDNAYIEMVFIFAITYTCFCLVYHFSSIYQDKKNLERLYKTKALLEREIRELS